MVRKLRRQLRHNARNLMPETALSYFRIFRSMKRQLFRNLADYMNSRRYQSLIQSKFPDITPQKNQGLVLDLGANLGHFAAACQRLGFSTICVEPHPDAIKYLEKRYKQASNFELIRGAITSDGLPAILQLHPDHDRDPLTTSLSASLIAEKFSNPHASVTVAGWRLDTFFNRGQTYEIVKVDIEGAELFIFEDLMKYAPNIKRLLLETHSRYMLETKDGQRYSSKLVALNTFIRENRLSGEWFTDWV